MQRPSCFGCPQRRKVGPSREGSPFLTAGRPCAPQSHPACSSGCRARCGGSPWEPTSASTAARPQVWGLRLTSSECRTPVPAGAEAVFPPTPQGLSSPEFLKATPFVHEGLGGLQGWGLGALARDNLRSHHPSLRALARKPPLFMAAQTASPQRCRGSAGRDQ